MANVIMRFFHVTNIEKLFFGGKYTFKGPNALFRLKMAPRQNVEN